MIRKLFFFFLFSSTILHSSFIYASCGNPEGYSCLCEWEEEYCMDTVGAAGCNGTGFYFETTTNDCMRLGDNCRGYWCVDNASHPADIARCIGYNWVVPLIANPGDPCIVAGDGGTDGAWHSAYLCTLSPGYGSCPLCSNSNPDCCGSTDPCCGSTDPCCGSSDPCCGSTDPCCGSTDPFCGKIGKPEDTCTSLGSSANYASGNLFETEEIIRPHSTILPIALIFSYNSLDTAEGPLGRGWTHNYNMQVTKSAYGTLTLREESGKKTYYYWDDGTGRYRPNSSSGDYSSIALRGMGFQLTRKDGTIYRFDPNGRLLSIIDRNYNNISFSYIGNDLTTISDSFGRTIHITYAEGKIVSIIDSSSRVTQIAYDGNGYLSSITDPAGNTRLYTYGVDGKMLSKRDPRGNVTTYAYDENGRVTSATNSSGTKAIEYGNGNSATITERDGGVWTYTYDSRYSVPLEVVGPNNIRTTYVYDDNRHLISQTDSEGNRTSYTYDDYGNILTLTDPMNNTTAYTYDDWGQVMSITDPAGNVTNFTYDYKGNLESVSDPLGNTVNMIYDGDGRLVNLQDAKGKSTYYTYNAVGLLNSTTDPLGNVTIYTYTADDNIASVTDAKNHVLSYDYDSLGRVIQMRDQLENTETYTYDTHDNTLSVTDRKGQTNAYTYDTMNRLILATYADGSSTTYTYDTLGRLTAINDSVSGPITYDYASANCGSCGRGSSNRIIRETTPLGSISYTYDSLGRRTGMTATGQQPVNYTYDANGHLTVVDTFIDGAMASFSISYDALGRRIALTFPNGVTTNYSYDNGNRLLSLEHLNPLNSIFEWIGYAYDANGNRTIVDRPYSTLPASLSVSDIIYNEANQMLTFDAENISYDANGNMTTVTNSCGTSTYSWDVRNRLVGISGFKPDCTTLDASFTYDALGRRIAKTINGKTTRYLYDGIDIVQEIENGQVTVNYVRTLNIDEPLARIESSGTVRYYHADALGSIITLTDETGTEVTEYYYDPFGKVIVSGEISDNPFQYTGRENDGTGLYYYRARYYSAELQRFISEDPILKPGNPNVPFLFPHLLRTPASLHAYNYTENNPVKLTDPSGEFPIQLIPKLISCPKAVKSCLVEASCWGSIDCADEHRDPQECFDRGETEVGSSHQLKKCFKPECKKCMDDLVECGVL